jgi:peptidoglycan L-alanyl-D-glutamate endopeptidase CwlK
MALDKTSMRKMAGVDVRLQRVMTRAAEISRQPFRITEGLRTLARQRQLVAAGASRTLRSRHITGHAVDVVALIGSRISWEAPLYMAIRDAVMAAAAELGVTIRWGGDWDGDGDSRDESFFDSPHFELPRTVYGDVRIDADAPEGPGAVPAVPQVPDRKETEAQATLAVGRRGADVARLQSFLIRLGRLDGVPDRVFGAATRAAVMTLQRDAGLDADGVVGPRTWRAIEQLAAARKVAL